MISDEDGLDSVIGAIMLILVCMACSALLLSIDNSHGRNDETEAFEKRFDCVLSSTVELSFAEYGMDATWMTTISNYLVDLSSLDENDGGMKVSNQSMNAIAEVIDFYFGRYDGWSLVIKFEDNCTLTVAARTPETIENSGTRVMERPIFHAEGGLLSIKLTVAM
jgi:hypothetical protein